MIAQVIPVPAILAGAEALITGWSLYTAHSLAQHWRAPYLDWRHHCVTAVLVATNVGLGAYNFWCMLQWVPWAK